MTLFYTETPAVIKRLYRNFWIEISVPSPSPADTIIERDENDKCIKIDDEYKQIQKRFYVDYDYEVFVQCRNKYPELIEQHLLNKGKKPNIKVFKECRPCYCNYKYYKSQIYFIIIVLFINMDI